MLGVYERAHEPGSGLERKHRVVEHDRRHSRHRPAQQILEAWARRRGHRHRIAVAAESAGDPDHVTELRAPAAGAVTRVAQRSARGRATAGSRGREIARACARSALHMVIEAAVQVPVTGAAGDQPGLGEATEGVRDRRPLGADELAEQPVGERAEVSRIPPGSTRPQRAARCQRSSASRTSRRGWQEIARSSVEVAGSALGATQQRLGDLRPRPDPLGEVVVKQREPSRLQRHPRTVALDHVVDARGRSGWSRSPGAEQLAHRAISDARVRHQQTVQYQQAGPMPHRGQPRSEIAPTRPASSSLAVATRPAPSRMRTSNSSARSSSASSTYAYRAGDSGAGRRRRIPTTERIRSSHDSGVR